MCIRDSIISHPILLSPLPRSPSNRIAPTETADVSRKKIFWAALDSAVKDVPPHEQLFVLMDANARTGKRGEGELGSKDNEVLDCLRPGHTQ